MKNNLLIITNLYPYKNAKHSSTFNEQQIAYLSEYYEKVFIICPIPWTGVVRGQYKPYTKIFTKNEKITVYYPVYFYTPGILRSLYWFFYFLSVLPVILRLKKNTKIENLLATWLYPDGFSAFLISKILRIPLTVKAHGSDVNLYATKRIIGTFYRYYLNRCKTVITVSEDLKEKLINIGINKEKIKTIYNGIDLNRFTIYSETGRKKRIFDHSKKNLLYIGNLKKSKGIFEILRFYKKYNLFEKNIHLHYVGTGPDSKKLSDAIRQSNLMDHIRLHGKIPHTDIPLYLNEADFLILLSENEGIPNVMLESFACGTPAIIKNVGGIKEFFKEPISGAWIENISENNIDDVLFKPYNSTKIRKIVEDLSWGKSANLMFNNL